MRTRRSGKAPNDQAVVDRWWTWLLEASQRARISWVKLSQFIGKYGKRMPAGGSCYLSRMRAHGCLPPREVVEALAGALEANRTEALLMAGYVPLLEPDQWLDLLGQPGSGMSPQLVQALHDVADLPPAEQRKVAAWLDGLRVGMAA
jgi:hypothetical protein